MAKPVGRRKRRSRAGVVIACVVCLIALSLAVRWLRVGPRPARTEEPPFQIEVLNGTTELRVAMDVAKELRRSGIDVLIVDNAERSDFKESVLVDRRGNARLMRRLGKLLRCRNILEQTKSAPVVDATFIVGYDRVKPAPRARARS
jgi:hypothetical protein